MDRRPCPRLYALLQRQETSTSLVTWEGQKERGLPRAHALSLCNIPPHRQTGRSQGELPKVQDTDCGWSVGDNTQELPQDRKQPRRRTERPATNMSPTWVTPRPRGLFTEPRRRFVCSSKAWTVAVPQPLALLYQALGCGGPGTPQTHVLLPRC